jgi:hypothetical protein
MEVADSRIEDGARRLELPLKPTQIELAVNRLQSEGWLPFAPVIEG